MTSFNQVLSLYWTYEQMLSSENHLFLSSICSDFPHQVQWNNQNRINSNRWMNISDLFGFCFFLVWIFIQIIYWGSTKSTNLKSCMVKDSRMNRFSFFQASMIIWCDKFHDLVQVSPSFCRSHAFEKNLNRSENLPPFVSFVLRALFCN